MVATHGKKHPASREGAAANNLVCHWFEDQDLPAETEDFGYSFFGRSTSYRGDLISTKIDGLWMTLNCYKFELSKNFAGFRRFRHVRQQL